MSFLDKFKGRGRDADRRDDDLASMFDEVVPVRPDDMVLAGVGGGGMASLAVDLSAPTQSPAVTQNSGDSSILSEVNATETGGEYSETRLPGADGMAAAGTGLPLIGKLPLAQQQRALIGALALGLGGLIGGAWLAVSAANEGSSQVGTTGQALMQSQRLAKSVSQALLGSDSAFGEVRESADVLGKNLRALKDGSADIKAVSSAAQSAIEPLVPLVERAEKNAGVVLAQQKTLTQVGQALRAINRQSSELLETAETVSSLKLQQDASAAELSAVGQLVMLTQRIGKSANEFLTTEGVSPEAVFLLGKDLNSFREIANGLLNGSAELRLAGTKDAQTRERLQQLVTQYEKTRTDASAILNNLQGLVAAREAQASVVADSETLRKGLEALQSKLEGRGLGTAAIVLILLGLTAAALSALGLLRLFIADQGQRAKLAESQRVQAQRQENEAKRVNDANQAAILRLMNELQTVAEGDLTQTATVTEDITGAIADSVNYTVEELRMLVEQVQGAVGRVTDTTLQVESTSTELLAASTEQLREIRETGESVLQMAGRINTVFDAGPANGLGGAPVAGRGADRPPGGGEHDRRHEHHARADPGNLQAHQAPGRVVAGDR